ncbi:hypothetical protein DITRI_Ditri17bG0128900 [Diplodiscus trichospermus]
MEAHGAGLRQGLLLAFCMAGIWSAYIYQGFLQETPPTKRFGPDGKRFEHLGFLNLEQNAVCLVGSYIMIKLWPSGSRGGAPWWTYWSAGIINTVGPAMPMGIEALKYISYPAHVLAKSIQNDSSALSFGIFSSIASGCCWPEFHFPDDKSIWLLGKHNHYHNLQVCQHRGVFSGEWQSTVYKAMGLCTHGLHWVVIPNLPQVEEVAEAAEEEKGLKWSCNSFELLFPNAIFLTDTTVYYHWSPQVQ